MYKVLCFKVLLIKLRWRRDCWGAGNSGPVNLRAEYVGANKVGGAIRKGEVGVLPSSDPRFSPRSAPDICAEICTVDMHRRNAPSICTVDMHRGSEETERSQRSAEQRPKAPAARCPRPGAWSQPTGRPLGLMWLSKRLTAPRGRSNSAYVAPEEVHVCHGL